MRRDISVDSNYVEYVILSNKKVFDRLAKS